ncbi:hypothetical protein BaRGS_00038023, partial [Batillaria attramentaria]
TAEVNDLTSVNTTRACPQQHERESLCMSACRNDPRPCTGKVKFHISSCSDLFFVLVKDVVPWLSSVDNVSLTLSGPFTRGTAVV